MSAATDTTPMELHMFSAEQSEALVELLTATAHFHHTGERLGLGHTVNFGRPWQENSRCDHGLISLPYLDGPTLETLYFGPTEANFYWLIPVTKAEVEFKKRFGLEALEQKFEEANFDYLDANRESVV